MKNDDTARMGFLPYSVEAIIAGEVLFPVVAENVPEDERVLSTKY